MIRILRDDTIFPMPTSYTKEENLLYKIQVLDMRCESMYYRSFLRSGDNHIGQRIRLLPAVNLL